MADGDDDVWSCCFRYSMIRTLGDGVCGAPVPAVMVADCPAPAPRAPQTPSSPDTVPLRPSRPYLSASRQPCLELYPVSVDRRPEVAVGRSRKTTVPTVGLPTRSILSRRSRGGTVRQAAISVPQSRLYPVPVDQQQEVTAG